MPKMTSPETSTSNATMSNAAALSSDELAFYRREGYLIRAGVFSKTEIQRLQQAMEQAINKALILCESGKTYILDGKRFVDCDFMTIQFEHQPGTNTVRVIEPADHLDPVLGKLAADNRILAPMRQIIGTDEIAIWTNKLNAKRAREGSGFGWHQDSPYWIHDCRHVDLLPNVMFTFDDADNNNGCLQVIRASHRQGCLPGTDDGTQLGGFYTSPDCFDTKDAVSMIAPAGSLIFFDPHIIHGSQPNHSDSARRAMVLTYQPANFPTLKSREIRNLTDARQ